MTLKYAKRHLWFIIPGTAGLLTFYVLPFFASIYYSLIDNAFNKRFVGIANYINLFKNEYFLRALKNSFVFTGVSVPLLMVFSMACSFMLLHYVRNVEAVKLSLIIPILLPTAAIVLIWQILFGENSYLVSELLGIRVVDDSEFYKTPIILLFLWKNSGYNIILFTAGLMQIPRELYEASELDGAGKLAKYRYVTLPLLMPTVFFVLTISIVNSFKVFKETYLLYGQYPQMSVYFIQHYMNNQFMKLNYERITTCAIIFAVIVLIIVFMLYKFESKFSEGNW